MPIGLGTTLLRVVVATIFIVHGVTRAVLGTVDAFGVFLGDQGLPFGFPLAWGITAVEIVGGGALGAGRAVRPLVVWFAVELLGGIVLVHAKAGWFVVGAGRNGMEYSVLIIACLAVVGLTHSVPHRPAPRSRQPAAQRLDGIRMRAVATGSGGEVDVDTLFVFTQQGSTVSARYGGGAVPLGYLVGTLAAGRLSFRYAQVDLRGEVHGGRSICDVEELPDGRLRLLEHFQWESRDGSGTNVLEEVG